MALDLADFNLYTRGWIAPLVWAVEGGHEAVIKLLLEREDVNPNTTDWRGWTPIFRAASKGNERVVKLLLERGDVDPNTVDHDEDTPVSWAAWYGHEGIVKMLLEGNGIKGDYRLTWPNTAPRGCSTGT